MDFDCSYGYDEVGYPTIESPDYSDIENERFLLKKKNESRRNMIDSFNNRNGFSPFPKKYIGRSNLNHSIDNPLHPEKGLANMINKLSKDVSNMKENLTTGNTNNKLQITFDEKTIFYLLVFLVVMVVIQHFQIKKLSQKLSQSNINNKSPI